MIHRKTQPVGIDVHIDRMQLHMDATLSGTIPGGFWENYDRAYKNPKEDGKFTPEIYTESGEYREVFFNDTIVCGSFFLVDDESRASEGLIEQGVSIIFHVQLDRVFNTSHRADEEFRNLVVNALQNFSGDWEFEGTRTGIKRVYEEFDTSEVIFTDMSFFHVLRLDFTVTFETSCCVDC